MLIGNLAYKCTKIKRLRPNFVIACAGSCEEEYAAHKFYSDPDWRKKDIPKLNKRKSFECIFIEDGIVYFCINTLTPILMEHKYYSIGTGTQLSMAAMEMGMTAEEAVKFASKLDNNTNDEVETFHVREHENLKKTRSNKQKETRGV